MAAPSTPTSDFVTVEMGPLHDEHAEAPSETTVTHRRGRVYHWPALLSTGGVTADAASVATAAAVLSGSRPALYATMAFDIVSALIHVIEGIVSCILQPRKALEENVEAVGKASSDVESQLLSLKKEIATLQVINKTQETQLEQEREGQKTAKLAVDAKVEEVSKLTLQLEEVNKGLIEAKQVAEAWKQATEQVTQQVAKLQPSRLEEGVEGITKMMQKLDLSKKAFGEKVDEFGASAAILRDTQVSWGKMVDQLQATFQGLTVDFATKKKILDESETRIQSLSQRVTDLQDVDRRLEELTPKYEKVLREMEEAKRQLAELSPILQSPEFIKLMQSLQKT